MTRSLSGRAADPGGPGGGQRPYRTRAAEGVGAGRDARRRTAVRRGASRAGARPVSTAHGPSAGLPNRITLPGPTSDRSTRRPSAYVPLVLPSSSTSPVAGRGPQHGVMPGDPGVAQHDFARRVPPHVVDAVRIDHLGAPLDSTTSSGAVRGSGRSAIPGILRRGAGPRLFARGAAAARAAVAGICGASGGDVERWYRTGPLKRACGGRIRAMARKAKGVLFPAVCRSLPAVYGVAAGYSRESAEVN